MARQPLAYVRISNDERGRSPSPDRQREEITAHAAAIGLPSLAWHADEGLSGFSESRPGWQAVLAALRSGRADTLVATSLSRLHRRVRDAVGFYEDYLVKRGVRLILVHDRVDTSTPEGKLAFTNHVTFNEYFRNVVSLRTRRAFERKRERGEWLGGRTPYGYQLANGLLAPDEREQGVVRLMLHLALGGASLTDIAAELERLAVKTKHGSTTWQVKTVARILQREAKKLSTSS